MHLIEKHIIKPSNELYPVLDEMCFKSKNLYNKANYIIRQEFINNKRYINYFKLQKMLQDANDIDYRSLPATCSQQTLKLLDQNWKSFFRSIKDYTKNKNKYNGVPKLPKYKHKKKGRFVIVFTVDNISKKHLKQSILKLTRINYEIKIRNTTDIRQDTIQQVRIIPMRNKYYKIEIVYKKQEKKPKPKKNRIVAVDVGIDNLMAVTSNVMGLRPFIVNGRPLKSINQYYNNVLFF